MKHLSAGLLPLFLVVPLCAGCRKAAAPSAISGSSNSTAASRQAGQPGQPGAAPTVKPMPASLPNVIAKVNDESVERWELETAVKRAEAAI